jgi:formylglycine-generating enzyme required for sulfatase activity
LLTGTQRTTRTDDATARLELLGMARRERGRWLPRNPLLTVALAEWLRFALPAEQELPDAAAAVRGIALEQRLLDLQLEQTAIEQRAGSVGTVVEQVQLQRRARDLASEITELEAAMQAISPKPAPPPEPEPAPQPTQPQPQPAVPKLPFLLKELGLSDEEIAILDLGEGETLEQMAEVTDVDEAASAEPASEVEPMPEEPVITPLSLEEWGLSAEEIAQLEMLKATSEAEPMPEEPVITPLSLEEWGLSAEEIAQLEMLKATVPELVEIPAGPFLMGSSETDALAEDWDWEKPQHRLELPTYWIGKTPVTNAQFRPFVEGDGYTNADYWTEAGWRWRKQEKIVKPEYWDNTKWNGDDYPVVGVNWFEVVAYCRWLAAQTGIPFRLPTEAEWEKAARGPDGLIYPWGNAWEKGRCNSKEAGKERTTPVGSYPDGASPYGALDMAGNVWEWTATKWLKEYPYQLEEEWTEDYLAGAGSRAIRGGSWGNEQRFVRGADRYYFYYPRYRFNDYGVRLASHSPS